MIIVYILGCVKCLVSILNLVGKLLVKFNRVRIALNKIYHQIYGMFVLRDQQTLSYFNGLFTNKLRWHILLSAGEEGKNIRWKSE